MKFIFDRDSMLKEIGIAQEIISNKNTLSILSNVLLVAENNSLLIKATDVKVTFETTIPVDVETEGQTTIFCDKFISILNSIPSGNVEFIQKENDVVIKPITKKVRFQLKSMASDKFPEFTFDDNLEWFDIAAKDLKEMIQQTIFAVSDDQTRYFMNGVYFEKEVDKLILVATDGRRLSYISKGLSSAVDFEPRIVPPKVLYLLLKRMYSEGDVSLAFNKNTMFIKYGNYHFSSVLIEGQFPNYRRVIPEIQTNKFQINRRDLMEALKRVGLLVEKKSGRIYFTLSDGNLAINSSEVELGNAKEEIPCRYAGDDISMALNCLYVEEPLKLINSEYVTFEFTESMKAVTIKSDPEEDFFHLVMPMQME